MRPSGRAGRERGRTFNEEARRTQIVTAAIETIAELDYAQTSFTQIAKRAGLSSTSLISYHFTGKRELVKQVVEQIYADIGGFLTNRLQAQTTAPDALRAYIEANVEFAGTRRAK